MVQETFAFTATELSGRKHVRVYRPRNSEVLILSRHNYPGPGHLSLDNFPLYEVFGERCYEPPALIDKALSARAKPRVVDLGAHLGYFGAFVFSRYPSATMVAFEPEPTHAGLLRRCVAKNGLEIQWQVIEAYAGPNTGTRKFAAARSIASHDASLGGENRSLIEVEARDVFAHLDGVDLLKIDIEGGEWPILLDTRFGEVLPRAVVMEYHSVGCPGENAKQVARDRFEQLGYHVEVPSADPNPDSGPFWGRGILWAWRG